MNPTNRFLLSIFILAGQTESAFGCENGWIAYRDEQCIKLFTNLLTYNEAKDFCFQQGNEDTLTSLIKIKEEEMQQLVINTTTDIFDSLWLGGRYDETTSRYKWDDGEPLAYSNWQEGYPRDITDSNICIEMRPLDSRFETNSKGQWGNVVCGKRNLVICQKSLSWSLQDAVNEIKRLRRDLVATQENLQETEGGLEETQKELIETRQDLFTVSLRIIPVGYIYVEYYNQPDPRSLWPDVIWRDITSMYSGLFFRASGGDASSWGHIQAGCAPRITQTHTFFRTDERYANPLYIPANGWSDYGYVGDHYQSGLLWYEGLKFYTEGCEVRPRNQAVRIWKRIG